MSLFVFNPFRASEELLPAQLRSRTMIAWLRVLIRPLKQLSDRFLNHYLNGVNASAYNSGTTYSKGDLAVWKDNAVYKSLVDSNLGVDPTGVALSNTNWELYQRSKLGVNQRILINGQIIILSKAINDHYGITSAPYIYFTEITPGSAMFSVTANVPVAVYNTLGSDNSTRNANIRNFMYLYVPAQHPYLVVSY